MKFINIHTHHPTNAEGNIEIISYFPGDIIDEKLFCSVGLHPWYIENSFFDNGIYELESSLNLKNVIALGEIGLDKVAGTNFELQTETFIHQLKLAEGKKLPVIIHCVKAYSEILGIKKRSKQTTPWIIHGFNENQQIAKELIKHGCFLSIGKALLEKRNKITQYLPDLPIDKIFLETDDDLSLSINDIYNKASTKLKISTDELKQQIYSNFKKLFPNIN